MRVASLFLAGMLLFTASAWAGDDHGGPVTPEPYTPGVIMTKAVQAGITPDMAVHILKEGNGRFAAGTPVPRDIKRAVRETAAGQYPMASIVSCIDSRVPAEAVFDQGLGDVFVARVAGNVINPDILGSLEYASKVAGSRAIVVLGHTGCGAVKGACDHVRMGNLTGLLQHIQPAVACVTTEGERNASNTAFVDEVTKANVRESMKEIHRNSPILHGMERVGQIAIVGAVYDVATGTVTWIED